MESKTFRLVKVLPGFLLGAAAVFDLGATLNIYNIDHTPEEADYTAMAADWYMVGQDLKSGMHEYEVDYVK